MTDNDTDSDDDVWPPDHPGSPSGDDDEEDEEDDDDDEQAPEHPGAPESSSIDEETVRRITRNELERFRSDLLSDLEQRIGSDGLLEKREDGDKSGGSSGPKPGGRIHTFDGDDDGDGRKKPKPSDGN